MVKLQTAGYDANSIFYSGTSYLPIGLGQIFTIQNKTVEHELVAIEVTHQPIESLKNLINNLL